MTSSAPSISDFVLAVKQSTLTEEEKTQSIADVKLYLTQELNGKQFWQNFTNRVGSYQTGRVIRAAWRRDQSPERKNKK